MHNRLTPFLVPQVLQVSAIHARSGSAGDDDIRKDDDDVADGQPCAALRQADEAAAPDLCIACSIMLCQHA